MIPASARTPSAGATDAVTVAADGPDPLLLSATDRASRPATTPSPTTAPGTPGRGASTPDCVARACSGPPLTTVPTDTPTPGPDDRALQRRRPGDRRPVERPIPAALDRGHARPAPTRPLFVGIYYLLSTERCFGRSRPQERQPERSARQPDRTQQ